MSQGKSKTMPMEIFLGVEVVYYTPNANIADHPVGAQDELHESEASEASVFCFVLTMLPLKSLKSLKSLASWTV